MIRLSDYIQFLQESPEFIGSTDFGLHDITFNRRKLTGYKKKKVETIEDTDDYVIFRTGTEKNGNIVMYDKKDDLIIYFVQLEQKTISKIGSFVTQLALWRDKNYPTTQGITSRIFFGYLLQKYKAIMSDAQQTENESSFWRDRMGEATKKNYSVGLVNLNTRIIIYFDPNKETYPNWIKRHKDIAWGIGNKFQAMRFIIFA